MDYEEALEYLKSRGVSGIRPGLKRIKRLMRVLGMPQDDVPVIHVAGTNGKGSVCTFISSILSVQGYKVGRFVSPSVFGYREMIQDCGRWISREELADICTRIKRAVSEDEELSEDEPTRFEIETAAAYLFFSMKKDDVAVVETGMGGSLDATNVVDHPLISVITSISMDHMRFLGDTIEKISAQKAGIIMPTRPVVYCADNPAASSVIRKTCDERVSAAYPVLSSDINIYKSRERGIPKTLRFSCYGLELETSMPGIYETVNAAVAVKACKVIDNLRESSLEINDDSIVTGIRDARWPGRFDVVRGPVTVIMDGAHNPDGALQLRNSVSLYLPGQKLILMMSVFADKDYESMLQIMSPLSDNIIVFRAPGERGLDENILADAASEYFENVVVAGSLTDACEEALNMACETGRVILQFGTLSVLRGSRAIWDRINP